MFELNGEFCSKDELRRFNQGQMRLKNLERRYSWRSLAVCAKYELQIVDRRPGNARALTAEEDNLFLQLTYESFDHIFRLAVEGSLEKLGRWVADPEKWQSEISDGMARSAPGRSSEERTWGQEVEYEGSIICCWIAVGERR